MPLTLLDALDDSELFGGLFKGGAGSWKTWRCFIAALLGYPFDEEALALWQHHTGRQEAPKGPFREAALVCGRRAGKSRVLALIAVWLACFRDYEPYLASGEVATIPVLAADRRQARTIMRYITGLMHDVPMLAAMITDETTDSIEINHRVVIEIHTASYRSLRSYTCAAILADEIAFYQSSETSKNLDEDILAAARPGLTTIPGAILLYCSSPYAQKGVLWSAYRKHWGQDDSRVLGFKGSSL